MGCSQSQLSKILLIVAKIIRSNPGFALCGVYNKYLTLEVDRYETGSILFKHERSFQIEEFLLNQRLFPSKCLRNCVELYGMNRSLKSYLLGSRKIDGVKRRVYIYEIAYQQVFVLQCLICVLYQAVHDGVVCTHSQNLLELYVLHHLRIATVLQKHEIAVKSCQCYIAFRLYLACSLADYDFMRVQVTDCRGRAIKPICLGRLSGLACVVFPRLASALHLTPIIIQKEIIILLHVKDWRKDQCSFLKCCVKGDNQQQNYMHLNNQISASYKKYEDKIKRISPIKRQYGIQYKIIEKNISAVLQTKIAHQIKPKDIIFSPQKSSLRKQIEYEFLPTFTSRQSSIVEQSSTIRDRQKCEISHQSPRLKSRCQSAFSRTQALKNASQQKKAEKVFNTVGVMLQEKKGTYRGEKIYTLNLLRIHGSSEKKIQINNYLF